MKEIKDQILKELSQLIEGMIEYREETMKKMREIGDVSSYQWWIYSGNCDGMGVAAARALITEYTIRELLGKLPD